MTTTVTKTTAATMKMVSMNTANKGACKVPCFIRVQILGFRGKQVKLFGVRVREGEILNEISNFNSETIYFSGGSMPLYTFLHVIIISNTFLPNISSGFHKLSWNFLQSSTIFRCLPLISIHFFRYFL